MRETRGHVLHAHVLMAIAGTALKETTYAHDVMVIYEANTPLHARTIKFHPYTDDRAVAEVQKANAQLLFRMLNPEFISTHMRVELEEAVVLALPQPYREDCQRELAGRLGLLAAPLPAGEGAPLSKQLQSPCELFRRTAAAMEPVLAMLEDNNEIGPEDAHLFPDALNRLTDVVAVATSIIAKIGQAMKRGQGANATAAAGNVRPIRVAGDGKL